MSMCCDSRTSDGCLLVLWHVDSSLDILDSGRVDQEGWVRPHALGRVGACGHFGQRVGHAPTRPNACMNA